MEIVLVALIAAAAALIPQAMLFVRDLREAARQRQREREDRVRELGRNLVLPARDYHTTVTALLRDWKLGLPITTEQIGVLTTLDNNVAHAIIALAIEPATKEITAAAWQFVFGVRPWVGKLTDADPNATTDREVTGADYDINRLYDGLVLSIQAYLGMSSQVFGR
jgi:hypothetical protein